MRYLVGNLIVFELPNTLFSGFHAVAGVVFSDVPIPLLLSPRSKTLVFFQNVASCWKDSPNELESWKLASCYSPEQTPMSI